MLASSDVFVHAVQQVSESVPLWTETLARADEHRKTALQAIGASIRALDLLALDLAASELAGTDQGKELAAALARDRERLYQAIRTYAPDEAYYWTPHWQEGERAVEAEAANGREPRYHSEEEFDAALRAARS